MATIDDERQTSNKSGVRSLGKKMDNSRHGFDTHPASKKVAGAYGKEEVRNAVPSESGTSHRSKRAALQKMRKSG
jgi:hypothetical protein